MSLEQHIEELRAELRGVTDPDEVRQIDTELKTALVELARLEAAAEAWPG